MGRRANDPLAVGIAKRGRSALVLDYQQFHPEIEAPVFLAPGSFVIGRAVIRRDASVWFNAVIRADVEQIILGEGSNLQDNAVLHADPGCVCRIGRQVTIGHGAIVHGAEVSDCVLIGMGAVILNRAKIGSYSIIGAGSLVTEGTEIPPGSVAVGQPARVVRSVTDQERRHIEQSAERYRALWAESGWALY